MQEGFGQPPQALVGNDAGGAKPLMSRAAESAQPVQRDGRLPAASLAENEHRLALRQVDDGPLAGVELDVHRRGGTGALPVRPRQQPWKLRRLSRPPFAANPGQRSAGPRQFDELALLESDEVALQDDAFELAVAQIDLVLVALRPGEEHLGEGRRAPVEDGDPGAAPEDSAEEHVALAPVGVAQLHVRGVRRAAARQERAGAREEVELLFEPRHRQEVYFTPR